jgi:peptidoglycan/LPS O-acetylase OafA/YrhL
VADTYYRKWTVDVLGAPLSPRGVALLFALCVGAVVVATLTPVARLRWRWLAVLGALTYPLYLVHQAPGWLLIQALHPVLPKYVVLALVVGLMLVLAYLVHRLVERPFGPRLRRAVVRDLTRRVPSQVSVPLAETPTVRWPVPADAPHRRREAAGRDRPVSGRPSPTAVVGAVPGRGQTPVERHSRERRSTT